jgi:hypothetical protein
VGPVRGAGIRHCKTRCAIGVPKMVFVRDCCQVGNGTGLFPGKKAFFGFSSKKNPSHTCGARESLTHFARRKMRQVLQNAALPFHSHRRHLRVLCEPFEARVNSSHRLSVEKALRGRTPLVGKRGKTPKFFRGCGSPHPAAAGFFHGVLADYEPAARGMRPQPRSKVW